MRRLSPVRRGRPRHPVLLRGGFHQVPEVDAAPVRALGQMADVPFALPQECPAALLRFEDPVHEVQDIPGGSPGHLQLDAFEGRADGLGLGAIDPELLFHPVRRRALEGIDRLLLVPHDEQAARQGAAGPRAPGPGEELSGQLVQDRPLRRRGVLRLVHQHVGQLLVELVEHPGGHAGLAGQLKGAVDEVPEVELARLLLLDLVGGQPGPGEQEDVEGLLAGDGLLPPRLKRLEPIHFLVELAPKRWRMAQRLRTPDPGLGRELLGEQGVQQFRQRRRAAVGGQQVGKRLGALARALDVKALGDPQPGLGGQAALLHLGFDPARVQRLRRARQRRPDDGLEAAVGLHLVQPGLQLPGHAGEGVEQALEGAVVEVHRKPGVGPGDPAVALVQGVAGQGGPRVALQLAGAKVVQHLEAGRHPRLEGEPPEELLAEGVQGLDPEAAGRLEGAGEEGAGGGQGVRGVVAHLAALELRQLQAQPLVAQHRPVAQEAEQPGLHLRGCGLGVGHAEDLVRRSAGEQQAGDPVDQGLGLSRPGVGRDEGGDLGVGGARLGITVSQGHDSPPSPMADHSRTRARWS